MDKEHKEHKRKSHLAKALLHRVHSQREPRDSGDDDDMSIPPSGSSTASQSNASLPSQIGSTSRSTYGSQRSRHQPKPSTASLASLASLNEGDPPASGPSGSHGPTSSPAAAPPSLDQSVKLFRLFEALRSGDTAAIQRAMRDQEPDARTSTSSIASTSGATKLEGTSVLHLAIQCAELPVIEFVLSNLGSSTDVTTGVNARDKDGNAPLHIGAKLGRANVVKALLQQDGINDSAINYSGQTPLDVAYTPDIFQQLQLFRSLFVDTTVRNIHSLVGKSDYSGLENVLKDPRVRMTIDVDSGELATDPITIESGGTLLHEAARRKDVKLIQILLLNGADPFRRDRKGKLPQDITKDDRTRAILKKSPAAAEARQGIQERTIVGSGPPLPTGISPTEAAAGNKEGREMKGYLKKWTNYTGGWKLRWFVLEEGVLSYYKHQGE